jgi:single-stranded DNA-binding protein
VQVHRGLQPLLEAGGELLKEVSFFYVTTWLRLAEVCGEYLKKGQGVKVVGRLRKVFVIH